MKEKIKNLKLTLPFYEKVCYAMVASKNIGYLYLNVDIY